MSPPTHAWLQIHFCVLLWGFTAIIGKLITLPALTLVWWRMALVTLALLLVRSFWVGLRGIPLKLYATYAGIGVLVALHWLTFYGSIKLSNASVATTCLALTPVFMAFIEPLVGERRFDARNLIFGAAVIPGVAFVVGGTPSGMHAGVAVGALSAIFVALFSALNKRFAGPCGALSVTGIEMAAGAVFLTLLGPLLLSPEQLFRLPTTTDAVLLVTLALGCTLLPFALSLVAMRRLSAFSVVLALNMEPVYTILLAIVLLGEQRELDPGFYIGVAIIVIVVFGHPWLASRRSRTGAPAPLLTKTAAATGPRDRDTNDSA